MAAILFKWLLAGWLGLVHPFYVGVTEIQQNTADKTVEISIKLFLDDFENALSNQYNTVVDLSAPKNKQETETLLFQYIQKNLQLKINGKAVELEYVGYEKEREAAWCYVQVSQVNEVKKLEVSNTLLYNVLDKQIHLIHLKANNKRISGKVMFPESIYSADF